jgi:hypothetical protein
VNFYTVLCAKRNKLLKGAEELERIARSPHRGDAPNINPIFGLVKMNYPGRTA